MKISKAILMGCLVAITVQMTACRGNKELTNKGIDNNADLPKLKIPAEDYYKNAVAFKTFNGKASMSYSDKKQNQKLNTTLKMNDQKDIWASVSAVGGIVEVARAYITPDSLQALLPLNRDAYALKYQDGLALIQAELDFATLQNLFMGNALILNGKPKNIKQTDSTISLDIEKDGYILAITYDIKTGQILQQTISNASKNFDCTIVQSNYKPLTDKQPFSFSRSMVIKNGNDEMKLDMNFSKAEIDLPLEIKFRIPESYTIKNPK